MGAFFLVRRSLFRELGGFDEGFFMYYEDLDFSRRARNAGWKSVFVGDAHAVHAGGVSSRQVPSRRLFHVLCSRTRYAAKHFGKAAMAVLLLLTLTVEPPLRVTAALLRRSPGGPLGVLRAYGAFLAAGLGVRAALQGT
jgi:GT2 family glycosyltransferase